MKSAFVFIFILSFFSAMAQKQGAFIENFDMGESSYFNYGSTGEQIDFKYRQGVPSLTDSSIRILSFKLYPDEKAGPGKGPEIISKNFTHFGTYSARLKVPKAVDKQANVGAVVGYFTYHVDSIPGLSEIDFEWLIADPRIIYIGTWTGHGALQRIGRTINLAEGKIYATDSRIGDSPNRTAFTGLQNQPEVLDAVPDYDASAQFYTYGFDWLPDRLVWWMLHPVTNEKLVLWDYQGTPGIPQNASRYRMNFWHTNNWSVETNPASLEKPQFPFELEVDWMAYKPMD